MQRRRTPKPSVGNLTPLLPVEPRKLIIDCDPGIDDAVALAIALFDPRLDVLAVTATAGNVPADQATANLQALVAFLDPPRLPRIGTASTEALLPARPVSVHGPDGLGGLELPRVPLHAGHPSEKVIWETIKAHPREVTILALGPLTNISRVLKRDPGIAELIGGIVACGGTVHAAGNATAVADFNFFCDPAAARHVVREPVTKTLVPLEATGQVVYEFDLLDRLPRDFTRAGKMLRPMLAHAFRAQRQLLGSEGIRLHDLVALVAVTNPELFERESVVADVESAGELTAGMLVVDRRPNRRWRPNADLLVGCDAAAVQDCVLRGLQLAGEAT
jgi:inosine-uridine nucleoside N-ribohydrolase